MKFRIMPKPGYIGNFYTIQRKRWWGWETVAEFTNMSYAKKILKELEEHYE